MNAFASEFDFLRLLIGLDTAVAGALIYGQEHLLHVQRSRWLLAVSVASFVLSLFIALRAFRVTANADMVAQNIERHPSDWKTVVPAHQLKVADDFPRVYRFHLLPAMVFFQVGVLLAFIFFVWNIWTPTAALTLK